MAELVVQGGGYFSGEAFFPGDKSLAHRLLIFGAMAEGTSVFFNMPHSRDVRSTVSVLRGCGVDIRIAEEKVVVKGSGVFQEAPDVLYCGNSGTTARLMMGALAGATGYYVLSGDKSLRKRPMARVTKPLSQMGARISGREGARYLPVSVEGQRLKGKEFNLAVASAQVKTAVIIAGLKASGVTKITEPYVSRDHTERLLPAFGVNIDKQGLTVSVEGDQRLQPFEYNVPGDISSASFFLAGAAACKGSRLVVKNVLLNSTRTGFLKKLKEMGADVRINVHTRTPEPAGDVLVQGSRLKGVKIRPAEVPSLIDEIPLLAILGAVAEGVTEITGAEELRVKESDRIKWTVRLLRSLGAEVKELPDGMVIEGPQELKGGTLITGGDHRIAMAAAIGAAVATGTSRILGFQCVSVSFPEFPDIFRHLYVK